MNEEQLTKEDVQALAAAKEAEAAEAEADEAEAEEDTTPQSEIDDGSATARAEATEKGWPVETTDGDRVLVTRKESTPAGDILVDADGNKYAAAANTAAGTVVQRLDENGRLPKE